MKKLLFASLLLGAMVVASCNNETDAINTVESLKTAEMRNFDSALKSLMKPENRSTPDEQRKTGGQLNDRSLDILYNASKQFLAVEVGRNDADNTTREAKEKIIS